MRGIRRYLLSILVDYKKRLFLCLTVLSILITTRRLIQSTYSSLTNGSFVSSFGGWGRGRGRKRKERKVNALDVEYKYMRSSSTCTLFDVYQTRFYLVYVNFLYKKAIPMYDITFDETACLLFMSILIVLSHFEMLPRTASNSCSTSSNSCPRIGNATACSARLSSCIGFGCRHSRTRS